MTDTRLRLAPELALPLELVTESVSILAIKRAGKSYTARKLVEQLHHARRISLRCASAFPNSTRTCSSACAASHAGRG